MAPQPLSRVRRDAAIITGSVALRANPQLAGPLAKIIADGAGIDYVLGFVLTNILRADPETGMAMYEALSGAEARRAALRAAAQSKLPPEDFELFNALEIATESARRIRNLVAHFVHGHTKSIKDALLLIDPQAMIEVDVGIQKVNLEMASMRRALAPPVLDKSRVWVYRFKDLQEASEVVDRALSLWSLFGMGIHYSTDYSLGVGVRTQLRAAPEVLAGLATLKKRKPPKGQPRRRS